MCKFKSAIILKDSVFVPPYDHHTQMLEELGIADTETNAKTKFVRAELIPQTDIFGSIADWHFNVDQDIQPDWFVKEYEENRTKTAIQGYLDTNVFFNEADFETKQASDLKLREKVVFGGLSWTVFKKDENGNAYILLDTSLRNMAFGYSNRYSESHVRKYLLNCKLHNRILVNSIVLVEGDALSLLTVDLYEESREHIDGIGAWWWLKDAVEGYTSFVQCVCSDGDVRCSSCRWDDGAVRPFCILKSDIFVSLRG